LKTKRQIQQAQRRRKQLLTTLGISAGALVVIAFLAYSLLAANRPPAEAAPIGEEVPVMPDTNHVAEGTDPGPYNSDPPTSGRHYANTLTSGFYNEGDVQGPFPQGYIVHNLEHGYIIFWYNCSLVSQQNCSDLKAQIKSVMDGENNLKVVAYPWSSTDVPVVLTSWGRMLRMEQFDPEQAREFVQRNRNKAPEPEAP
jgi:hypothetical protein